MSIKMRSDIPEDMKEIPEFFDKFDVRKPPAQLVDDKLTEILDEVFSIRKKLEKTFTRNELLAYDRLLIKHLSAEVLMPKLTYEIDAEFATLRQLAQVYEANKEGEKENELM
jgi:hypothetical protein